MPPDIVTETNITFFLSFSCPGDRKLNGNHPPVYVSLGVYIEEEEKRKEEEGFPRQRRPIGRFRL